MPTFRRRKKLDSVVRYRFKLRNRYKMMPDKLSMLLYTPSFRTRLPIHMLLNQRQLVFPLIAIVRSIIPPLTVTNSKILI